MDTRKLTRAAFVAAIYAALTLALAPISYSVIQVRVAEALTVLPFLSALSI
ncbi:MAG: QueT transporter family protein, partial [Bacillota bacterium]